MTGTAKLNSRVTTNRDVRLSVYVVALIFLLKSGALAVAQTNHAPPAAPASVTWSNLSKAARSITGKQSKPIVQKIEVKEITLGRVPKEMLLSTISAKRGTPAYWQAVDKISRARFDRIAVSPDQKRVAIVLKRDGNSTVVVNGNEEATFDEISGRPEFSPDSRRLAYTARRGESQRMVVDGVEGQSYGLGNDMYPIFSPDSKNVAYFARRGSNTVVVVGASESKPYRMSLRSHTPPAIVFSPDSKRFAYSAELGAEQWTVVVDGVEGKVYNSVTLPEFSPDSRHVLYVARRKKDKFVVLDDIEGLPFMDIPGSVQFSPDGKRVAYQAQLSRGNYVLVVDGQPSQAYEHIDPSFFSAYFSPNSQHIVFAARKGKNVYVVLDGKESPACDGIAEMPLFSPDSKQMAYAAARGWSTFIVLDGVEGKKYRNIYHPVFSPDSKHLAYVGLSTLSAFVVRDGKEGPGLLLGDGESANEIVFSPDSQRLACYLSVSGQATRVEMDGKKSILYQRVERGSLGFSPDSKHVAYWASPFSGEWRVYVDDYATAKYDGPLLLSKLVFAGPDSLHALAQRGDEILRLEIKIPPSLP